MVRAKTSTYILERRFHLSKVRLTGSPCSYLTLAQIHVSTLLIASKRDSIRSSSALIRRSVWLGQVHHHRSETAQVYDRGDTKFIRGEENYDRQSSRSFAD